MGGRKSRKAPPKKAAQTVPTIFDCPFCNNEKAVEAKLDKARGIGTVRCNVCDCQYQMLIHDLIDPIDVYSEWLDRCQEENQRS